MSALKEAIKRVTNQGEELYSLVCEVAEIDRTKRTCTVKPLNGSAALYGVRLQSALNSEVGLVVFPELNTNVVVTFLNKNAAYVALFDEIETIELSIGGQTLKVTDEGFVFNGGDLGGLIKINELKTQIERLNTLLKGIQNGFKTFVPVPSDGGAALKTLMVSTIGSLPVADLSNIEDEKITH